MFVAFKFVKLISSTKLFDTISSKRGWREKKQEIKGQRGSRRQRKNRKKWSRQKKNKKKDIGTLNCLKKQKGEIRKECYHALLPLLPFPLPLSSASILEACKNK